MPLDLIFNNPAITIGAVALLFVLALVLDSRRVTVPPRLELETVPIPRLGRRVPPADWLDGLEPAWPSLDELEDTALERTARDPGRRPSLP